jgi:regulator of sigma E protease
LRVGEREAVDWETTLVSILDEKVSTGRVPMELRAEDGWVRTTTIDVGDDATRLTEPGLLFDGLGFRPWQPPAVVGSVDEDGAAFAAGILEGDQITSIAGEPVSSFGDLQRIVSARPDQPVAIRLLRGGQDLELQATLGSRESDGVVTGFLGVGISNPGDEYWYVRKFGPLTAIGESVQRTWAATAFTVRMFGRMITGDVSIRNISGPINIAQFAGDSAARGLNDFLNFLALVSISLGVINLLPIPILDGGQIVYQSVELIKGSPLSERSQLLGQQVGILALLLLMSFAFYNDIARLME